MKKSNIFLIGVGVLCIVLLVMPTTVSAREELHENEIWITGFEDPIGSQWSTTIVGDDTDVNTSSSGGEAMYTIRGDAGSWELDAPLDNDTWIAMNNTAYPDRPDEYNVTSEGFWVSQLWGDTYGQRADQSTSIHFDYNVSMPVNMSDYIITSASVSAVVNASVHANDAGNGGLEVPGDITHQEADFDYIRYYLLVSDLPKEKVYEIASNQTSDLGQDSAGVMDVMNDTLMIPVSEENLIFFLTSVLNTNDLNFTITVGIRIFAEDNWNSDRDFFDDIFVKNVSLSFTYEKRMNQLTTVSWNGIGDSLNSTNVLIKDASFEYSYKIDTPWPVDDSPNSELRMFVSNKQITETIKLSVFSSTYQHTSSYNVTSMISLDENITISLQTYIGDNFVLDSPISVSIDNVVLRLTYIVIFQDPAPTNLRPYIYGSAGLLAVLAAGIGLYEGIFKFPAAVRTVRSLKRKVRRGKSSKPIHGNQSDTLGRNIFEEEKRHLNKVGSKPQHSQPSKKAAPKKDASNYKDVSPPEQQKLPEKKIEGSEKNA